MEQRELKKRLQTEKARAQRRLNAQERRLAKESGKGSGVEVKTRVGHSSASATERYGSYLQHLFFTQQYFQEKQHQNPEYLSNDSSFRRFARDQARCVFSLLHAIVTLLQRFFLGGDSQQKVFHVINTNIVDDTSTAMKGPNPNDRQAMYTIMNTVQDVHIRYETDQECCESFRIPTPLLVLETADAKAIHKNCMSFSLVTSHGTGRALQSLGIQKDLLPKSSWRTYVFIGDALRANEAAFRQECEEKYKTGDKKHLLLKIRCSIHQLSLVRRPCVLMVPRLWTTIVRLSHLYETLSFRKLFARTMASLVCQSFIYLPILQWPEDYNQWRDNANILKDSFRCRGKMRKKDLEACLDFLNGDLTNDSVFHYCNINCQGGRCCDGRDDSLLRCLKHIVPFFSRGFPVPLLYRFKHYDEAITFVTTGLGVHNLLSRTLRCMDTSIKTMGQKEHEFIDHLLGDMDFGDDDDGNDNPWGNIGGLFEEELSFQEQNAKRRQLVHQEVTRPSFKVFSEIVDVVIHTVDSHMNKLLARTEKLTLLTVLGKHHASYKEMASSCRSLFVAITQGDFGRNIIQDSCKILANGLDSNRFTESIDSQLQTLFTMILHLCSDTWKRFVHDFLTFQFRIFSLLGVNLEGFVSIWDEFLAARTACPKCFEQEFCSNLLDIHPALLQTQPQEKQQEVYNYVTTLLSDIATYTPVSSDAVEIKNGQVQTICSRRFRSAVRSPLNAKESSFLMSFIRSFELVKHHVEKATLPSRHTISSILKRVGKKGRNQHSATSSKAKGAPWLFLT